MSHPPSLNGDGGGPCLGGLWNRYTGFLPKGGQEGVEEPLRSRELAEVALTVHAALGK